MRAVNDDMDDLLRRAAKEYPLNTNSGQWEKITGSLHDKDISASSGKKNNRGFFWLLLLIPILLYHHYTKTALPVENGGTMSVAVQNDPPVKPGQFLKEVRPTDNIKKPLLANKNGNKKKDILAAKENGTAFSTMLVTGHMQKYSSNYFFKKNKTVPINEASLAEVPFPHSLSPIEISFPRAIEVNLKMEANERQNIAVLSTKPTANKKVKKFYAGLIYGTAATTIKFQQVKNYGFDLGVIAGYDIGKKWSIEAGVMSTQKKYYTDGKEFNTSKIYLPANTKIATVEGGCRMIELPIVARYHFSSPQKNTWFVSGGISSFLMKEESYDYLYLYTASGRTAKYSKRYKNASESWVSTAQLSGGFIYHVKDKFGIRAEPYIQIPLKGIGFGNLPLTHTGLRIGITKKLF